MKRMFFLSLILTANYFVSAQWTATNGPKGWVSIDVIAADSSTIFTAITTPGNFEAIHTTYKSIDEGRHWTYAGNGLPNRPLRTFAFKENLAFTAFETHIFRSFDLGLNWTEVTDGSPIGYSFYSLSIVGSTIFVASEGVGILRSDDNGTSWYQVNSGLDPGSVFVLIEEGGKLYGGTFGDGVYLTQDLGESWTKISGGPGAANPVAVYYLDVKGDTILTASEKRIHLSTDGGLSWRLFSEGISSIVYPSITSIAIGHNQYYATISGKLYVSSLTNPTWTEEQVLDDAQVKIITLGVCGSAVVAGTEGKGIYSEYETTGWTDANTGMPNGTTLSAIAIDGNDIFTSVKEVGVFRTSDKGNTWTTITIDSSITTSYTRDLFYYNNLLFAGTYDNGVFRSADHGNTWEPANEGISDQFIYAFGAMPPYLFIGADYGVYRSDNNGDTWTQVNNGLPGLGWLEVSSFLEYNGKLYVGLYGGDQDDYDNVYVTSDFGNTWSGIDDPFDDAFALTVCGQYLIAGARYGAYRYIDSTGQWTALPNGSSDYLDRIIREVASNKGILFSGSYGSSFLSYDCGDTWLKITDGLGSGVEVFEFLGTDVLAGPEGGGLFINSSLFTGAEDIQSNVTGMRIYPNPANNCITIELDDISEDARMSIFSISGQKVLDQPITELLTTINTNNLPPGAYFLRYENGSRNAIEKLIVD